MTTEAFTGRGIASVLDQEQEAKYPGTKKVGVHISEDVSADLLVPTIDGIGTYYKDEARTNRQGKKLLEGNWNNLTGSLPSMSIENVRSGVNAAISTLKNEEGLEPKAVTSIERSMRVRESYLERVSDLEEIQASGEWNGLINTVAEDLYEGEHKGLRVHSTAEWALRLKREISESFAGENIADTDQLQYEEKLTGTLVKSIHEAKENGSLSELRKEGLNGLLAKALNFSEGESIKDHVDEYIDGGAEGSEALPDVAEIRAEDIPSSKELSPTDNGVTDLISDLEVTPPSDDDELLSTKDEKIPVDHSDAMTGLLQARSEVEPDLSLKERVGKKIRGIKETIDGYLTPARKKAFVLLATIGAGISIRQTENNDIDINDVLNELKTAFGEQVPSDSETASILGNIDSYMQSFIEERFKPVPVKSSADRNAEKAKATSTSTPTTEPTSTLSPTQTSTPEATPTERPLSYQEQLDKSLSYYKYLNLEDESTPMSMTIEVPYNGNTKTFTAEFNTYIQSDDKDWEETKEICENDYSKACIRTDNHGNIVLEPHSGYDRYSKNPMEGIRNWLEGGDLSDLTGLKTRLDEEETKVRMEAINNEGLITLNHNGSSQQFKIRVGFIDEETLSSSNGRDIVDTLRSLNQVNEPVVSELGQFEASESPKIIIETCGWGDPGDENFERATRWVFVLEEINDPQGSREITPQEKEPVLVETSSDYISEVETLGDIINKYPEEHPYDYDNDKKPEVLLGDYLKESEWYKNLSDEDKKKLGDEEKGMINLLNKTTYWKNEDIDEAQTTQCMVWAALLANLRRADSPEKNVYAYENVNLPGELLSLPDFANYNLAATHSLSLENIRPGQLFITQGHIVVSVANDNGSITLTEANRKKDGMIDTYTVDTPEELEFALGSHVFTNQ